MASPPYTSDQMDALARILAEAALSELLNEISTREISEEQAAETKTPIGTLLPTGANSSINRESTTHEEYRAADRAAT
jgi:hypothetical protein